MIFGIIKSDDEVFKGDKIRFNVEESFVNNGEVIESMEVSIDEGISYIEVKNKKYIDFILTDVGDKIITLNINPETGSPQTFTKTIKVLDYEDIPLFSKDNDLYAHEPEIDRHLPSKWSAWTLIHYEAQKKIVQWLDFKGIRKKDGSKYVAQDIVDIKEVREWSTFLVLMMIFRGNSNQLNDIFDQKATQYENMVEQKAALAHISLSDSGVSETIHGTTDLRSVRMVRA